MANEEKDVVAIAERLHRRETSITKERKEASERRRLDEEVEANLTQALSIVASGNDPCSGSNQSVASLPNVAAITVDDPREQTTAGKPIRRVKLINIRNDPLGQMLKRKQIKEVQYKGGRHWQSLYEMTKIGVSCGGDPTKEYVDGGRYAEPDTERSERARKKLAAIDAVLGLEGQTLIRRVLDDKLSLRQIAEQRGQVKYEELEYIGKRFRECLDTLAVELGYAQRKNNPGPRRSRDEFDTTATYANNPRLYDAIHRARRA